MPAIRKSIEEKKRSHATLTAEVFIQELFALPVKSVEENTRYFTGHEPPNKIRGTRMSELFALARQYTPMPLEQIGIMLDSDYYEARMGAVSIMDFQARDKKTTKERRKELYDLYIDRHDRINNWDLVDRSAPYVVGGYLFDKDRGTLYQLARSANVWERRTAIVATYFFIRQDDLEDTFQIAELLIHDKHELIHKAVGSWIREAGKRDKQRLIAFLHKHAATAPRVTLRYAVEKLEPEEKALFMKVGK